MLFIILGCKSSKYGTRARQLWPWASFVLFEGDWLFSGTHTHLWASRWSTLQVQTPRMTPDKACYSISNKSETRHWHQGMLSSSFWVNSKNWKFHFLNHVRGLKLVLWPEQMLNLTYTILEAAVVPKKSLSASLCLLLVTHRSTGLLLWLLMCKGLCFKWIWFS